MWLTSSRWTANVALLTQGSVVAFRDAVKREAGANNKLLYKPGTAPATVSEKN
jgi:hypothetical protein